MIMPMMGLSRAPMTTKGRGERVSRTVMEFKDERGDALKRMSEVGGLSGVFYDA